MTFLSTIDVEVDKPFIILDSRFRHNAAGILEVTYILTAQTRIPHSWSASVVVSLNIAISQVEELSELPDSLMNTYLCCPTI